VLARTSSNFLERRRDEEKICNNKGRRIEDNDNIYILT
jgi:hypothetical protein